MASSEARSILDGDIKEVDVKEVATPFQEEVVEEWHIPDNHEQNLSFSDVRPADITVRNLEVEVNVASSFVDTLKAKFFNPQDGDLEDDVAGRIRRKKILKDVSADFPAGTITAIIGGSGSGKVTLYLRISSSPKA